MFIILSFLVIPPIVFGILFWSLLLSIVFFLRRRDHHRGIDWWWWKTPHKSDPVYSPGTFTHNKVLKPTKPKRIHIPGTYSKTMSFSEYKRRQNKQLQNRIAKPPHRRSFRHPFPSIRRPHPSPTITNTFTSTSSCLFPSCFSRGSTHPPRLHYGHFQSLTSRRCLHFCLGYWLLTQYHPRCTGLCGQTSPCSIQFQSLGLW